MTTSNGVNLFYESLQGILFELKEYNFFYCHKSYLVNYYHVLKFSYKEIKMSNGDILQIAQPRRKSMRKLQSNMKAK